MGLSMTNIMTPKTFVNTNEGVDRVQDWFFVNPFAGLSPADSWTVETWAGTDDMDSQFNRIVDLAYGGGGADQLNGGDGDDNLIGGAGVDHYNGGNGIDRVQYQDSLVGLRVDLQVSATNTGDAAGETYVLIEDIVSSSGNDSLFGNASANKLFGFDGVDRVFGRAGNDTLFGGDGNDIVNGGAGNDILVGGLDVDTFRFDGANFGIDRITDFAPGETIDLDFYAGLTFADLNIADVAGRAVVSFAAGEIILTGILSADVQESWFSFAP